jgi:hypothetical protein
MAASFLENCIRWSDMFGPVLRSSVKVRTCEKKVSKTSRITNIHASCCKTQPLSALVRLMISGCVYKYLLCCTILSPSHHNHLSLAPKLISDSFTSLLCHFLKNRRKTNDVGRKKIGEELQKKSWSGSLMFDYVCHKKTLLRNSWSRLSNCV